MHRACLPSAGRTGRADVCVCVCARARACACALVRMLAHVRTFACSRLDPAPRLPPVPCARPSVRPSVRLTKTPRDAINGALAHVQVHQALCAGLHRSTLPHLRLPPVSAASAPRQHHASTQLPPRSTHGRHRLSALQPHCSCYRATLVLGCCTAAATVHLFNLCWLPRPRLHQVRRRPPGRQLPPWRRLDVRPRGHHPGHHRALRQVLPAGD